jgi:solute:Na+ symporter, SSS family
MLLGFVILYLLGSVGIGLIAATRVHNTKDYAVAGRGLPFPVVMGTVFATWFGAESVFGISSTFLKDGLGGIVADPFGSSLCLVLAGILFSRYLYKLNIITLGDFFRLRFNRTIQVVATICIVISYLGWVAAQIKALGLLFSAVSGGSVGEDTGMIVGGILVLTYTVFGGMFSVAILDFVQMLVMIGGLLFIAWLTAGRVDGGVTAVVNSASAHGKFAFFPDKADPWLWLTFFGTWTTMMFGSIPQQDVFQRITSAKSAKIALWGSVAGASLYFVFTFVPIFIAYAATMIDPAGFGSMVQDKAELIIPTLVKRDTPMIAQVLFYGAVLSAIMSTASATLLAPSVSFAENIIKDFFPHMGDHQFLRVMRGCLIVFACMVLAFALNTESSIYKMVENAYKVTLAGAFVPLVFGILWKRATNQGALAAVFGGLVSWILVEVLLGDASPLPSQLIGLFVSAAGMIAGSLLPQWVGHRTPGRPLHELQHHAAAETHHVAGHGRHHA